ncbi:gem-associated protein 4 isoform X1 [Lethenteron reissneri]|uniref:gem-associated protein 4 isoform X1 n=1 Tax=Lethenteron reissneri TaxID=7753 RepID=UPI002AB6F7C4|nr:gem-associated protein 4 isoform X1 [Lethenteron reissneri]
MDIGAPVRGRTKLEEILAAGPLVFCSKVAILQGGLLLAERQLRPKRLEEMDKADWSTIRDAMQGIANEVCSSPEHSDIKKIHWKKKILALLWMKMLRMSSHCKTHNDGLQLDDDDDDSESDLFFPINHMMPLINRTFLFELVKDLQAAAEFAQLMNLLPADVCAHETKHFVAHVLKDAAEADVALLLDVWRGILLHAGCKKPEGELEKAFQDNLKPASPESVDICPAAKRPKKDNDCGVVLEKDVGASSVALVSKPIASNSNDIPAYFIESLFKIAGKIIAPVHRYEALANFADTLFKSALHQKGLDLCGLPVEEYVDKVGVLLHLRGFKMSRDHNSTVEQVREVENEVYNNHSGGVLRLDVCQLDRYFKSFCELLEAWKEGLCAIQEDQPVASRAAVESYRMVDSLRRLCSVMSLNESVSEDPVTTSDVISFETLPLSGILARLEPTHTWQVPDNVQLLVATCMVDRKMRRHQDVCELMIARVDWAIKEERWMQCLKKNISRLNTPQLVLALAKTFAKVIAQLKGGLASESLLLLKAKRLKELLLSTFSALAPAGRNEVLRTVVEETGGDGLGVERLDALAEDFAMDMNLVFNCITDTSSGDGLSRAICTVGTAALLAPRATVNEICRQAVTNVGAPSIMAQVLLGLPALAVPVKNSRGDSLSMLLDCLSTRTLGQLSTEKEERQFVEFLRALTLSPQQSSDPLISPAEILNTFVLPYLQEQGSILEFALNIFSQILNIEGVTKSDQKIEPLALGGGGRDDTETITNVQQTVIPSSVVSSSQFSELPVNAAHPQTKSCVQHWLMDCSPFPIITCLSQQLERRKVCRCPDGLQTGEGEHAAMEIKSQLMEVLAQVCAIVQNAMSVETTDWVRSVDWLEHSVASMDWSVRLHLLPILSPQRKACAPEVLFGVCKLPDGQWERCRSEDSSAYGPGTGLLAWIECCRVSDGLAEQMIKCLHVDQTQPEDVNLFSKGFLLVVTQILPECTLTEWRRVVRVMCRLLEARVLHVPVTLEYVQFLPLTDLRPFSVALRVSQLLLRVFQLLCGSSCAGWLSHAGWAHAVSLAASTFVDMMREFGTRRSNAAPRGKAKHAERAAANDLSMAVPAEQKIGQKKAKGKVKVEVDAKSKDGKAQGRVSVETETCEGVAGVSAPEGIGFAACQLFCHALHIMAMVKIDHCESLFLAALEILSTVAGARGAADSSCSILEQANQKQFLEAIAENAAVPEHRATLLQKISQL